MSARKAPAQHLAGQSLRAVRILGWSGVVLAVVAALIWFPAGGRDELIAGVQPFGWRVVAAGIAFWVALAAWFAAALVFGVRMFRSIINRLDGGWTTSDGGTGTDGGTRTDGGSGRKRGQ